MHASKGITLILAFIPYFGLLGLDKFYTGNPILGSIHALLTTTFIGTPISLIWNFLTVICLLILIFTKYNLLFYTKWDNETTDFDYFVAITITIYFILRFLKLYCML